jgi:acyl dehydratase
MLKVGDPLPAIVRGPIGRTDIARFAAGVNDFNPIHVDEEFAKGVGFPSVIAHGPLSLAYLVQLLATTFGVTNVRGVSAQFRAPVLPGDVLRVEGEVTGIDGGGGAPVATCAVRVLKGETVVVQGSGKAVMAGA